jgi:hypothetical protein
MNIAVPENKGSEIQATWRKIHTIQLDLKFFDVGCTAEYLCSLLEAAVVPDVHRQALELLEDEGCEIGPRGCEIQYVEDGEGVVGLDGFEMDMVTIGMDI